MTNGTGIKNVFELTNNHIWKKNDALLHKESTFISDDFEEDRQITNCGVLTPTKFNLLHQKRKKKRERTESQWINLAFLRLY